jgi:hypothetical protein
MTASELQRIVVRLSNWGWCRYWLHHNYPRQDPWLMSVQIADFVAGQLGAVEAPELESEGFTLIGRDIGPVYTIERTDEEGKPFRSGI